MTKKEFLSKDPKDTILLGQRLARYLKKGDIICLLGGLGSGKTTLTKGIAQGLKFNPNKVHSPSFVFLNIYDGRFPLYHFDLYRIKKPSEIFSIGYEEYLYGEGIAVIEWAQRLEGLWPREYLEIDLSFKKENERAIVIKGKGKRAQRILKEFAL
ncbi:MAG: tRNA (adenosine(37)-N6)-threonylcarbamoyltransferase complex ATPase subunit type 1 TsaE [Candidatus Omnitrophota bacterium]